MRDIVTDAFEVIALLALALSAGIFLARLDVALGLAGGAVVLLVESFAVTFWAARGAEK